MSASAPQTHPPLHFIIFVGSGQLVSLGCLLYSFTLFIHPMEIALGWSRTQINLAPSIGLIVTGIVSPAIGHIIDRYGARWTMACGAVLGACGFFLWSQATSLESFIIAWLMIGAAIGSSMGNPIYAFMVRNYTNARKAVMTFTLITGLASSVMIPVVALLISSFGWREAIFQMGCAQLFCALLYALLIRDNKSTREDSESKSNTRAWPPPALRSRTFWLITLCFVCYTLWINGVSFHIVPLLTATGISDNVLYLLIALHGPAQVLSRIAILLMGEKVSGIILGYIAALAFPLAIFFLISAEVTGITGLIAFALLHGIGSGLITISRVLGVSEIFGKQGFASISGVMIAVLAIPQIIAPIAWAWIWSWGLSYMPVLWGLLAITCFASILFWKVTNNRQGQNPA